MAEDHQTKPSKSKRKPSVEQLRKEPSREKTNQRTGYGYPISPVSGFPPEGSPLIINLAVEDSLNELKHLLLHYRSEANRTDSLNQTAMFYTAFQGHFDSTKLLLENEADPLLENNQGANVLHAAAQGGQKKIIVLLLGTTKIDIDKATNSGDSALSIASTHQHTEVVAFLLESGADVDLRDNQGRSPLQHIAAQLRQHQ